MVTGRAAGGEGDLGIATLQCIDGVEDGAGGAAGGLPRSRRGERVGVEVAPAASTEAFELAEVLGIVDASKFVEGRQARRPLLDRLGEAGQGDAGQGGVEPAAPFRMPLGCVVKIELGRGIHGDGHSHESILGR